MVEPSKQQKASRGKMADDMATYGMKQLGIRIANFPVHYQARSDQVHGTKMNQFHQIRFLELFTKFVVYTYH